MYNKVFLVCGGRHLQCGVDGTRCVGGESPWPCTLGTAVMDPLSSMIIKTGYSYGGQINRPPPYCSRVVCVCVCVCHNRSCLQFPVYTILMEIF